MQVNFLNYNINQPKGNYSPNFEAKGKPLTLKYILEQRGYILPDRVRKYVQQILSSENNSQKSLLEIHRQIYSPLLECQTLEEAQKLYPEFSEMLPTVPSLRYKTSHPSQIIDNFGLRVLQEYWGNLKTKDEIVQIFNMNNRGVLDFALNKINFVGFQHNYKTLLKASDKEGNKLIAEKTKAWNRANPELRRELNRHAAQGCKTEEYKAAQSKRMIEYDEIHFERKEKISRSSQAMWDICPEVKQALADFRREQGNYFASVYAKAARGQKLSDKEEHIIKGFYKRFWAKYPDFKQVLSQARQEIKKKEL